MTPSKPENKIAGLREPAFDYREAILMCAGFFIVFSSFLFYLLKCHYVKAYSDPANWIVTAEQFIHSGIVARWSVVYAMYLAAPLKLLGLHYVFLSNIPWILVLLALLGLATRIACEGRSGLLGIKLDPGLCGLLTVVAGIYMHRAYFLELVNPLREPVVLSLAFGSYSLLLLFERCRRGMLVPLSGVLSGLAVGMREPLIISGVSVVFMYLGFLYRHRPRDWYVLPGRFLAGCLVGLVPFFVQNHMFSGYWWYPNLIYQGRQTLHPLIGPVESFGWLVAGVPVLAFVLCELAGRRARSGQSLETGSRYRKLVRAAFVVCALLFALGLFSATYYELAPGTMRERFPETGLKTLNYIHAKLGIAGVVLACIGFVSAIGFRRWPLLLMALPSLMAMLFFWSHVPYVKPRYVLNIEIYIWPFVGVGIASTIGLAGRLLSWRVRPSLLRKVMGVCLSSALAVTLLMSALRCGTGLKAWHLKDIGNELKSSVEEPCVFLNKTRHFATLLSTAFGGRLTEHYKRWDDLDNFSNASPEALPAEYMPVLGRELFQEIEEVNHYTYEEGRDFLISQWFDYVPVMDLGKLPHKLIRYGREMDGWLYKLEQWTETNVTKRLEVNEPGDYLLWLDVRRLWDYPERSYCRVRLADRIICSSVTNNLQLAELHIGRKDIDSGFATLRIESDAGLTVDPYVRATRLGDTLAIGFGGRPDMWYCNHVSDEFMHKEVFHASSVILTHKGSISVPNHAPRHARVFAVFDIEFYQESDCFRGMHTITASSVAGKVARRLPGRLMMGEIIVPLGKGKGKLEMQAVEFLTDLPAWREQTQMLERREIRDRGYVKIQGCRVWSVPGIIDSPLKLRAGMAKPFFESGFYSVEGRLHQSVCWTEPEAELVFPRSEGNVNRRVSLTVLDYRHEDFQDDPVFFFNNRNVSIHKTRNGEREIVYTLSDLAWKSMGKNSLKLSVSAWNPCYDSGLPDDRDLGVMISEVEVLE